MKFHYWKWAVAQWDRVIGWICVVGGAVLTLSGALSVSRAQDQLDQLSYLASGPAIGLFLLGVGAILILTADLRDEWRKLDEAVSLLRRGAGPEAGSVSEITLPDAAPDTAAPEPTDAVAVRAGFPALAVAGVGVLGGATGVNQSFDQASALRWTQLSAAGLTLALVAVVYLYLRGRRSIGQGLTGIAVAAAGPAASVACPAASVGEAGFFVVEGSPRYHAAGCELLRFSEARPIAADEAAGAGLSRCPICR